MPFAGVQISGAWIVGDVDLENAKLIRPIEIINSRVEGAINLSRARTDSLIMFAGSLLTNTFDAVGMQSESDLYLRHGILIKRDMALDGAKIDGDLT